MMVSRRSQWGVQRAGLAAALCFAVVMLPLAALAESASPEAKLDPLQQVFYELAPGVWLGNRPDSTRLPVTPNTTFVISDEGVVVFDGGNLPLVADRMIAQIRSLTNLPVTHVIASHWHMDHVLGLSRYRDAWPDVQLISHPYTREQIGRYLAKNEQNMRNTVPDNAPGIQAMLDTPRSVEGQGPDAQTMDQTVAWLRDFVDHAELLDEQYQGFEVVYPNVTISDQLTIHSGKREIVILHLGTGNTPGDLVMWLPQEKILASGDIVVWPTPYGHGGYPVEWSQTLENISEMDWKMLVPGHGEVQTDRNYLQLMSETLRSVATQIEQQVAAGASPENAVKDIDLQAFESQFTGGDPFLQARFREWFSDPITTAAWRVANGKDPELGAE